MTFRFAIVICALLTSTLRAQTTQPATVRVVSYNIENFRENFQAFKLDKMDKSAWPQELKDLVTRERKEDAEDNREVAQAILSDEVKPDILFIQECAGESDLNYFNKTFLNNYFASIHVFPTNTDREQNLAMFLRPGFKVIKTSEDYHKEADTDDVNSTDRLFARGPAFVLIETPTAKRFWLGTTHAKSKSGNSVDVTKWRNAEARRTHQIIEELRKTGPAEVLLMGDLNDELGYQEFEQEAGGDAIDLLLGPKNDRLDLATKPLIDAGKISFHGYGSSQHRSFIDQAVATPEMTKQIAAVHVADQSVWLQLASDHYPVVVELEP